MALSGFVTVNNGSTRGCNEHPYISFSRDNYENVYARRLMRTK
jgi:hypothetical protein